MRILVLALMACVWGGSVEARQNVLLICVDDLRPELASFGATHIHSPNIDQLASEGRAFLRHYVNAPSCGPSRYSMLTGCYGPRVKGNEQLALRSKKMKEDPESVTPSMPEWFRSRGYTTVSVGKVSHYPGGRCGKLWNDEALPEMPGAWDRHLMPVGAWETPKRAMHGLANGAGRGAFKGKLDVFQAGEGEGVLYPDDLILEEAVKQLDLLADQGEPFFLAVGFIRPHLPFGAPAEYKRLYDGVKMPPAEHTAKPEGTTTWHASREFNTYNHWDRDPWNDEEFAEDIRRHYAACVSYADANVGQVLDALENSGRMDDTIVVLWGDHGWHLGEQAIWGKHALFEESLHAPLIIRYPGMKKAGVNTEALAETVDIFPTLCDLTGLSAPEFSEGRTLRPQLEDPRTEGRPAVSCHYLARTLRTDRYRLIKHDSGAVELYDHSAPDKESVNIAGKHPELVEKLTAQLNARKQK